MKIVIHPDYGCFHLTSEQIRLARHISGNLTWGSVTDTELYVWNVHCPDIDRTDPILVRAVEEYPNVFHQMEVVDIPKGERYRINEYDGAEEVEILRPENWLVAT